MLWCNTQQARRKLEEYMKPASGEANWTERMLALLENRGRVAHGWGRAAAVSCGPLADKFRNVCGSADANREAARAGRDIAAKAAT